VKKSSNIVWHAPTIVKADRIACNNHKPAIIWLTGLSGSGKSTIAHELENQLFAKGCHTYVLDGDNIRHGLNGDLGFSPDDRVENIRRIGEVAKLMVDAGLIVITAFISPYRSDRQIARDLMPEGEFIEVYVNCSLGECESRDPKGMYKKARAGEISNFTGIDAPYEEPANCELVVDTEKNDLEGSVTEILNYLTERELLETS
jgi:adenylylsulfate kinase